MNCGKSLIRFLILFFVPLVGACDSRPDWVMHSYESEKYGFTRFLESIEQFPYTADKSKRSRVSQGYTRLTIGMRKDVVEKIMGTPDDEMFHYKPKQKTEELVYSTWGYHLKRFERELGNENFDEAVMLYFKPNEELYWADPGNLEGLRTLGGPDLYPESIITVTK